MMSVGMLLFGACSQRSMPDEAESGMLSRQEGDAQEASKYFFHSITSDL